MWAKGYIIILLSLNFNINKKYIDQLGVAILTLNDNKTWKWHEF